MFKNLFAQLVIAVLRSNQGQEVIRRTIETVQAEQDEQQRQTLIAHFGKPKSC